MDLRDRIEAHKELITDRLDPDFGLLDKLLASRSLTRPEIADVKAVLHPYGRSGKLLEYVLDRGIYEGFLDAIRDTQQTHLVNFISSNGKRRPEFGDDWPLTEREISILDTNQHSLVDLLDTCDLLLHLYSHKVVNNRQTEFVSSKTTFHEKNEALLEILRRTSLRNYNETIYCLHLSNQSHIADIFKEGGGVVRVRSELETDSDVNEVEDELITKITEILGDRSLEDSARILERTQLRLIAVKRGNSIILYFLCKTSAELINLQEMQTSGKLANVVREMFNEMLSRPQVINLRTTLYDEDFSKCELDFRSDGTKGELEESCNKDYGSATSNTAVFGQEKMADAGEKVEKQLREITECPICMTSFTDPRMLPCIHTFCFECLKSITEAAQKKSGDKMPCPLCRKEFIIPENGMNGLQKNFFMINLLEFKTTLHLGSATTLCDMCNISYEGKTEQIPTATMRCLACQDNYCDSCVKVHQYQKLSRNHQVVKIGSETKSEMKRLITTIYCSQHIQKPLDYYCPKCKKIVCVSCFLESHASHKCKDVTTVDDEFRQTIQRNSSKVSIYAGEMLILKKNAETSKADFLKEIVDKENAIHKRNQELKDMIDEQTKSLLDELSVIKSNHVKEMETGMKEIDRCCTILRSFEAYCTELISKGSASDICSSVDELVIRADELERIHKAFIGHPHQSVEVAFQATDLKESLQKFNDNIVGNIQETTTQFENCAIVVIMHSLPTFTKDVMKINLQRPNEISTQTQRRTGKTFDAVAAVFRNTMYIIGIGVKGDEIWKYNLNFRWTRCGSLVRGRRNHSAAFIDEVLYICGGSLHSSDSVLDSVEAYNAVTDKCTAVGKLAHSVYSSGNCVPFQISLYIFGGSDENYKELNDVQVYNTKQNICTLLSKPMPRAYCMLRAALWETSVILVGHNSCLIFNFDTEKWEEREMFKTDVVRFGLVLDNGRIFVIGGGKSKTDKNGKTIWKCRDDVRYVPLRNILEDKPIGWKIHGKLPRPCLVHACAVMRITV